MYIQITDHCNMMCSHCCYSCGPRKKNFMSLSMFEAALDFIGDETLSIGGGEPTLHPQFWAMIGISLGTKDFVWLATNGSQTKTALRLAYMASNGVLGCDLSIDHCHAPIDKEVVEAFMPDARFIKDNDMRGVRTVHYTVKKAGRAIKTQTWMEEGCVCEDIFVDPNGNIWSCGCKRLLLGHVLSGWNTAGERHNRGYQQERFADIDYESCFFHSGPKYRRYVKWLKEAA